MIAPKLRFSEFKDEWIESKIGENFNVTSGTTPLRSEQSYFANPSIYWVKTTDLNNGIIKSTEEKISKIALAKTSLKILPKNTVFVAMYGGFNQIGRTGILSVEATCNQALSAIYPNENFNPYFVLTYLNHKVDDWKNFAASSRKDPNITKNDVLSFPIIYPTLTEQTKIAEFLSAVDDKISQLSRQLELLNQYKKGVMQKIFSQEIRFKNDNGEDFGEWEEVPLNQIASKVTVKNRGNKVTEVLTNSATQGIIKQSDFFDREIVSESNINGYYVVEVDDFVYNPRISVHAPVGPIKRNKITQGIMSPLYTVFRFKEGNLDFLSYFFGTNFWHDYVKSVANSGARHDRMNITNSDFLEMPILLPSIQEQEKIAEFLTAIDKRIDHTTAQLTHTKQWKKGLLQQMFV